LFYNIISFENNDWLGEYTYHFLLISSSIIAVFLGFLENIEISHILKRIIESIKSITIPIIILLLVGALAGTWKVSGIIPAMVYYGLNLVDPYVFLPLTLIVSTLVLFSFFGYQTQFNSFFIPAFLSEILGFLFFLITCLSNTLTVALLKLSFFIFSLNL
jgi:hypothetical protein